MKNTFSIVLSDELVQIAKKLSGGNLTEGIRIALKNAPVLAEDDRTGLMVLAILERFGTLPFKLCKASELDKGPNWLAAENEFGGKIGYALRSCKNRVYCGYQITGKLDRERRATWQLVEV